MKLRDKVCVVTGGVQGIGRAIVEQYVAEGARAAILDLDGDAAEAYAAELRGRGIAAGGYGCDVSVLAQVRGAAEAAERDLGRCDVLVNNAGLALIGPSLEFSEEDWRRSIDVMETGVFFCCQVFGRQLVRGGGAIVNIASMNATVAFPMRLAYNAAKAAGVQMTQVLAIEWAEHGVRVNSIGPGVTRTALVDRVLKEGYMDERAYLQRTPMKRLGRPEEIAKAALFLAAEEDSSFVTGHFLVVDGGWSAFGFVLP
jgi:NAD(P)-dependent dehydrogenase (short-subunit alcohol dehydrogenase family)